MGKLQSDKTFILTHPAPKKLDSPPDASPPQIPPRMKKNGPALPEKPAHIRAKTNPSAVSSQPPREPLRPRILNLDKFPATEREVLVAASKSGRERPVEKRQREPAKLLKPTGGGGPKKEPAAPSVLHHLDDCKRDSVALPSLVRKEISIVPSKSWALDDALLLSGKKPDTMRKSPSRPLQPVLLIPRNLLTSWGSAPVSYALWTQRDIGRGVVVKPVVKGQQPPVRSKPPPPPEASATSVRSGSVTRSGSLTSQGSSSSDSGGETFPKSVLKKQKRAAANTHPSKGLQQGTNRRVEPKKNVTFNAFATVQLMEE